LTYKVECEAPPRSILSLIYSFNILFINFKYRGNGKEAKGQTKGLKEQDRPATVCVVARSDNFQFEGPKEKGKT
jgi:hypothetical protein